MPLTQQRMLDLLTEYERFVAAHDAMIANVHQAIALPFSPADKLDLIKAELATMAYMPREFMRIERRHYNTNARRNDKMREKMAARRRAQGVPLRDSPQYRLNARRYADEATADAEYDRAMGGRGIESTTQPRQPRSSEATQHAATQHAIKDKHGNTMTQEQVDAMNSRGIISGDDI